MPPTKTEVLRLGKLVKTAAYSENSCSCVHLCEEYKSSLLNGLGFYFLLSTLSFHTHIETAAMLLNFPLTSILVFSSMRPVYTGMANVGMVFLSAVSAWCWSICRSWSRGIWEPLFHTNELHAFQPTISMFFCFRRGDRWTAVHSDKKWENGLLVMYTNAVCVYIYMWGRAQQ